MDVIMNNQINMPIHVLCFLSSASVVLCVELEYVTSVETHHM